MSAPLRPCGLDLGSARSGFVATIADGPRFEVVAACQIPVPPCPSPPPAAILLPVIDGVIGLLRSHGCDLLVLEIGWLYSEGDSAAKALAVARHHEVCAVLSALLCHECARAGIATVTIARSTWARRLVPGVRGVTSEAAREAAMAGLTEAETLHFAGDGGQHARDALGALRGHLAGAPVKVPKAEPVEPVEGGGRRVRVSAPKPPRPERVMRVRREPGVCAGAGERVGACGVALRSVGSTWCPACAPIARAAAAVAARGGSRMAKRRAEDEARRAGRGNYFLAPSK